MGWLALRLTWQTRHGKTRWALTLIVALTLASALYDYPAYYNDFTNYLNPRIASLRERTYPQGFAWVRAAGNLALPAVPERPFKLGLDLVGGTQLIYDADTSKISEAERASALDGVRDVIERRVNAFGVAEPVVQTDRSGEQWRVLVELPGIENVEAAIAEIGETPLLEFKELEDSVPQLTPEQETAREEQRVAALKKAEQTLIRLNAGEDFAALARELSDDSGTRDAGGELNFVRREVVVGAYAAAIFDELQVGERTREPVLSEFGYHIIQKLEERTAEDGVLEVKSRHILFSVPSENDFLQADPSAGWKNTELSGKQLKTSTVVFDPQSNQPQVQLTFDEEGAKLFEEITSRNVGRQVGIFLDGFPISIPTVQQAISGGQAVITGTFTVDEAKLLAQRLNAGALPVPISLISQQTIGPRLGAVAIAQSLRAGLIGFLLVALFMIVYYRLPGLIAVLALMIYAVLTLAIFKLWPVTLTLAGITGFVLSIGMAVDANVLIFERLKEELRRGQPLATSVDVAFSRAWTSIRDSNVSSLITCLILYWFGTSIVRGFALTLALGVLVSMFSAISVTRVLMRLIIGERDWSARWFTGRVSFPTQ